MKGADLDSVDPALACSLAAASLLDTTCARLMTYTGGSRAR